MKTHEMENFDTVVFDFDDFIKEKYLNCNFINCVFKMPEGTSARSITEAMDTVCIGCEAHGCTFISG